VEVLVNSSGLQILNSEIKVSTSGDQDPLILVDIDPESQKYVELNINNLSGQVNVTLYIELLQSPGFVEQLSYSMIVTIPSDEISSDDEGKFPWWQVIAIIIVLLIILFIITLIFVENISYAFQMALFKGGTIDEEPILTLIHDKPGIQFRELLKYSNFGRRDLVSTLVSLEKSGNIRPLPDGVLVRFYPTVGSFVDGPLALNRHQESIAKVLFQRKKITHQGLSIETGISKKRLKREAKLMELKGALSERTGKEGPEYFLSSKQKKRIKEWMNGRR
jgi:predicted transcriptional regulator